MTRSTRSDMGFEAVKAIHRIWEADEDRTVWLDDGFDWWPGGFAVRVRVSDAFEEKGSVTYKLQVTTDFWKGFEVTNELQALQLSALQIQASSYAYKYLPGEVRKQYQLSVGESPISLTSIVYIREDNVAWMPRLFAGLAIMQPIDAEIRARGMGEMIGAEPNTSNPSESGAPLPKDEILEVVDQIYAPMGQERSKWIETGEFENIAAQLGQSNQFFINADSTGLTLETPFIDDTALIRLRTEEAHPQLGNGLLVTLQLPIWRELPSLDEVAYYNLIESIQFTQIPLTGSWCLSPMNKDQGVISFSSFIPNALYQPNLAANSTLWMIGRAQWARQTFFPDEQDMPLAEILEKRFSAISGQP